MLDPLLMRSTLTTLVALVALLGLPHSVAIAVSLDDTAERQARIDAPDRLRPTVRPWRATEPIRPWNLLRPFDPPAEKWLTGHRGVDIGAGESTPVYAPLDGIVTFRGVVATRPVLTTTHNSVKTTYEPVESPLPVGSRVRAGQHIGTVASGGHCSHRCLHWGSLLKDAYIDPLWLLEGYTPVLKPPIR